MLSVNQHRRQQASGAELVQENPRAEEANLVLGPRHDRRRDVERDGLAEAGESVGFLPFRADLRDELAANALMSYPYPALPRTNDASARPLGATTGQESEDGACARGGRNYTETS